MIKKDRSDDTAGLADALNKRAVSTPRGRQWEAMSVKNALARA
jgi:hypothetical protein